MDKNDQTAGNDEVVWGPIDEALRRSLSAARATKGWSWDDVAREVQARGWDITPGNLMTRQSRMSFRGDELVLLLDVLGVREISVPALLQQA